MRIAVLFVLTLSIVCATKRNCSDRNVISYLRDATYNFSVRLLDRVSQQTDSHFVFSPLSTWWQLVTLDKGARGSTRKELWHVTRYHKRQCFQRSFNTIISKLHTELKNMTNSNNIMAINNVMDVKETFKMRVSRFAATTPLLLNFYEAEKASDVINEVVQQSTDGVIENVIDGDNLNITVLVLVETGYFQSDWLVPFNPLFTANETFFNSERNAIGEVRMMTNLGYYSITDMPFLNAKVLDLPFNSRRKISMLVILPNKGSVREVHYNLKYTTINTMRNMLRHSEKRLVTVRLPRFKIRSEVDNLPELLFDMGLKRIFNPILADFRGISNYKMHVSYLSQVVDIEVTEKGVQVDIPDFLVKNNGSNFEFNVNRPFAFLVVDWRTNLILFAGSYSEPSVF